MNKILAILLILSSLGFTNVGFSTPSKCNIILRPDDPNPHTHLKRSFPIFRQCGGTCYSESVLSRIDEMASKKLGKWVRMNRPQFYYQLFLTRLHTYLGGENFNFLSISEVYNFRLGNIDKPTEDLVSGGNLNLVKHVLSSKPYKFLEIDTPRKAMEDPETSMKFFFSQLEYFSAELKKEMDSHFLDLIKNNSELSRLLKSRRTRVVESRSLDTIQSNSEKIRSQEEEMWNTISWLSSLNASEINKELYVFLQWKNKIETLVDEFRPKIRRLIKENKEMFRTISRMAASKQGENFKRRDYKVKLKKSHVDFMLVPTEESFEALALEVEAAHSRGEAIYLSFETNRHMLQIVDAIKLNVYSWDINKTIKSTSDKEKRAYHAVQVIKVRRDSKTVKATGLYALDTGGSKYPETLLTREYLFNYMTGIDTYRIEIDKVN